MKFTLLNRVIEISDGRKNYMQILHHFRSMAQQAATEFRSEYNDRMGLVILNSTYSEKFLKTYGSDNYMDQIVMRYVAETRKYLTQYGVYDLSDTKIWNNAIVTEDRSVSRLQYELNSFIVECLERNEEDSAFISRIKSKFEGSFFDSCLQNDVFALCDYTLKYLEEHDLMQIQFVYKDDAERARAIYQNLKDSPVKIPQEEQAKLAVSMIESDPREGSYFECVFANLPVARQEIAAIAMYLGHNLTKHIETDIQERFDPKEAKSEEEALKMKENLLTYLKGYGLDKSPVLEELEDVLYHYDVKARTYDGVLYGTRELRAKAEADDKELYSLYSGKSNATKDEIISFISQIDSMQIDECIKNKHISLLQKKIREIEKAEMEQLVDGLNSATEKECAAMTEKINAYPAVFAQKDPFIKRINDRICAIWETELEAIVQGVNELSEEECETAKQQIQAHCAPNEMKKEYIGCVENRICAIWDAEDFERFSELYKQTPIGDSAAAGQTRALIEREGRTETKDMFVAALCLLNETEIASAAKYAIAKESGIFASLLNMGKKESYQILTLDGRVMHPAIEVAMQVQKEAKGTGLLGGLGKLKKSFGFGKATSGPSKACPNCGKAVAQDVNFCPICGSKID